MPTPLGMLRGIHIVIVMQAGHFYFVYLLNLAECLLNVFVRVFFVIIALNTIFNYVLITNVVKQRYYIVSISNFSTGPFNKGSGTKLRIKKQTKEVSRPDIRDMTSM